MSSKSKQSDTELELNAPAKGIHVPDSQTGIENADILEKVPGDRPDQEFERSVTQTETGTASDDIDDPDQGGDSSESPQTEKKTTRKHASSAKTPSKGARSSKKSTDNSESGIDKPGSADPSNASAPDESPDESKTDGQSSPRQRQRRKVEPIVSIDEEGTVETDADKRQNDLIDMAASMKTGKILTGTIRGTERPKDNQNLVYTVIHYSDFKVIIPEEELLVSPIDFKGYDESDTVKQRLRRIPNGTELAVYVANSTPVYDKDGIKMIHSYLAIDVNRGKRRM